MSTFSKSIPNKKTGFDLTGFLNKCGILELVRTHFGEKIPSRKLGKAAEPHR
jgi:hypothetical protein